MILAPQGYVVLWVVLCYGCVILCPMVAGLAKWSEHLPSTNVAQVRFLHSLSYVDRVCCFSTLPWEVFPRVLQFSPLFKTNIWFDLTWFDLWNNNYCKIMIWGMLNWFPLEFSSAFDHIHMLICTIDLLNIIIIYSWPHKKKKTAMINM